MKTYHVLSDECDLSVGGWCFTHSTGDGPIYCVPLTPPHPGIDETARDNDADALADLGDVGDLRWDV